MQKLSSIKDWHNWTILEFFGEKDVPLVGEILFASVQHAENYFSVGWTQPGKVSRTTIFRGSSWACTVMSSSMVLLHRTGADSGLADRPTRSSNLYILVRENRMPARGC